MQLNPHTQLDQYNSHIQFSYLPPSQFTQMNHFSAYHSFPGNENQQVNLVPLNPYIMYASQQQHSSCLAMISQSTIIRNGEAKPDSENTTKKSHPKVKFTNEEDEKLLELVEKYGSDNWHLIAQEMESRNVRQCRERFKNYLSPEVINGPWTEEEDQLLDEKYSQYGPKWKLIATFFLHRTDINVKSRWQVHFRRERKEVLKANKKSRRSSKRQAALIKNSLKEYSTAQQINSAPNSDPLPPIEDYSLQENCSDDFEIDDMAFSSFIDSLENETNPFTPYSTLGHFNWF